MAVKYTMFKFHTLALTYQFKVMKDGATIALFVNQSDAERFLELMRNE